MDFFNTNKFCNEVAEKLNKAKDKIILDRMKELGIDFDLKKEEKLRFKNFMTKETQNETTYYYNDGSEKGLRIITFVSPDFKVEKKADGSFFMAGETYY